MKQIIRLVFDILYVVAQVYCMLWVASWSEEYDNPWVIVATDKYSKWRIASCIIGVISAPALFTLFEYIMYHMNSTPRSLRPDIKDELFITSLFRQARKNSRLKKLVDTSEYEDQDPDIIRNKRESSLGIDYTFEKGRSILREQADDSHYLSAQLLFTTIWTVVGTINSGWWWRYTNIASSTIVESSGQPYCVGDQCNVYYLVWDSQYVPEVSKCLDMYFLGVMFAFNSFNTITTDDPIAMVRSFMFWVNQSIMPAFTMLGALAIRQIAGPDYYNLNYITVFHPVRWLSLYSFMNIYLTDSRCVKLGKGNEVKAVILKGVLNVVVMIILFSFTYFSFEWDPSTTWLQIKDHLDEDGNFIESTVGYFHNGLWSCIYLTFVTLSTVGYGDFSPSTELGRLFVIMFVFWMLYYFPKLVDELSAARENGLVKHGSLPSNSRHKDTVVVFSRFDDRNIKDFTNFLFAIESANVLDYNYKVSNVIAVAPNETVDEVANTAARSKISFRVCVVQGDIAFGSDELESLFMRLGIEKWEGIRDVIFLSDFTMRGNTDATLSARQNMSRIHSVRSRINPAVIHQNQLTSVVYDNQESILLTRTSRGNNHVMSLFKAAALGKSLTTCPGVQSLLFPLFSISHEIQNQCIKPLLQQSAKDLDEYRLSQVGLMSYVQRFPTPSFFHGVPFEVVSKSLYFMFSICTIGVTNRAFTSEELNKQDPGEDVGEKAFSSRPHWKFWINPSNKYLELNIDWHDLIIVCNSTQRNVMQYIIESREDDIRATLWYYLKEFRDRDSESIIHVGNENNERLAARSCLFDHADRTLADRLQQEAQSVGAMIALGEASDGPSVKSTGSQATRIDRALATLARSEDHFVLVLGTGRAWQDIIQGLIQDNRYNIIHVIAGDLPDFESIWVNDKDFDWSYYQRYHCISNMRCDKHTSFEEIGVNHPKCLAALILPDQLMIEEQEEGEYSEDTHVYATVQRLKAYLKLIGSNLRLLINLENRVNTPFFSALLENTTRDLSQEVADLDTLGPDLKLYSSRAVMSGNMWVDGMVNIMGYNQNIFPRCVNTKVLEELLGLEDLLCDRGVKQKSNQQKRHTIDLKRGVISMERGTWKNVLPDAPISHRSYKTSFKELYHCLLHRMHCIPIGVHRTVYEKNGTMNEYVICTPPPYLVLDYNSHEIVDRVFVVPSMDPYASADPDMLTNAKATRRLQSPHVLPTISTRREPSGVTSSESSSSRTFDD